MKKMSSYQKLKAENLQLRRNLMAVVCYPESVLGTSVKHSTQLDHYIEEAVMFGDASSNKNGIINQIKILNCE